MFRKTIITSRRSPAVIQARLYSRIKSSMTFGDVVEQIVQQDFQSGYFTGCVVEREFKLVNFHYTSRYSQSVLFTGRITASGEGSKIEVRTRPQLFLLSLLIMFALIGTCALVYGASVLSGALESHAAGAYISSADWAQIWKESLLFPVIGLGAIFLPYAFRYLPQKKWGLDELGSIAQ